MGLAPWGMGWVAKSLHCLAVEALRYYGGMNDQPKIDASDIINRIAAELSAMTARAVLAESQLAALQAAQAEDGAES